MVHALDVVMTRIDEIRKHPKSKRKTYIVEGLKVEFIPYADYDGIGYIRIEKNGEHLCSFDGRRRNRKFLLHLKSVIQEWLKEVK
jgi:hypothetical protein